MSRHLHTLRNSYTSIFLYLAKFIVSCTPDEETIYSLILTIIKPKKLYIKKKGPD